MALSSRFLCDGRLTRCSSHSSLVVHAGGGAGVGGASVRGSAHESDRLGGTGRSPGRTRSGGSRRAGGQPTLRMDSHVLRNVITADRKGNDMYIRNIIRSATTGRAGVDETREKQPQAARRATSTGDDEGGGSGRRKMRGRSRPRSFGWTLVDDVTCRTVDNLAIGRRWLFLPCCPLPERMLVVNPPIRYISSLSMSSVPGSIPANYTDAEGDEYMCCKRDTKQDDVDDSVFEMTIERLSHRLSFELLNLPRYSLICMLKMLSDMSYG
jgi:hypothetical protein